jgi:hypothetical protein
MRVKAKIENSTAVLAPDIAQAFPSDELVNAALRLVLEIAKLPQGRKTTAGA